MTFRAKPVTTRKRRLHLDSEQRTNFWVTLGFALIIFLALAILVGAIAAGYYDQHFRVVARVQGVEINRDRWNTQQDIERFRIRQAESRVREQLAAGTIDEANANDRITALQQREQDVGSTALEALIEATLQGVYAREEGITVGAAEVDAAIAEESSIPELRKVQAIFVEPESDAGGAAPSEEQVGAARKKAEEALTKLKTGAAFAEVAGDYSTDASRDNGGEYGFIDRTNPTDAAWVESIFALEGPGTTEVIEGEDGVFRIGRVTEIREAVEHPDYLAQLPDTVSADVFRSTVEAEVMARKLQEKIAAPAITGDVEQVFLHEIVITGQDQSGEPVLDDEVKASHILYSPKDDPSAASTLPATDPEWAKTEGEAKKAADELKAVADATARAARFVEVANEQSDDKNSGARGGDLGWFGRARMVQEFGDAVFEGTHQRGDVIGPVRSQFGWHVILYVDRRPPAAERVGMIVNQLKKADADFAALARRYSDAPNAASGGEVGWVARYELDNDAEDAVFALKVGDVSEAVLTDPGDYHVYKVTERQKRPIEPARQEQIKRNAFEAWYQPKKDAADIFRDQEILAGGALVP